jgi:hypothetical protein
LLAEAEKWGQNLGIRMWHFLCLKNNMVKYLLSELFFDYYWGGGVANRD